MATYYVKNGGSDSADGLSDETAFATPTKAQTVAISGDIIRLKRGSRFYSFDFTKQATELNPLQWDCYGDEELPLPVISGYLELTGWTSIGSNLYKKTVTGLHDRVNFLKVNAEVSTVARWPKEQTYYKITGGSGSETGTVTGAELTGKDFTGGEVVTKKEAWVIDRQKITAHSGSTLNFTGGDSTYPIKTNYGYCIQNHRSCLTENGDWCQEGDDIVMYGDPGSLSIQYPSTERIWANNADNNLVQNIRFEGLNGGSTNTGYDPAFLMNGSKNLKLHTCEFEEIGNTLFYFESNDNNGFELLGSKIKNCLNIGFWNRYSASTYRFNVQNNLFEDIGMVVGAGTNGGLSYTAIAFAGSTNGGIVTGNRLKNVGYNGINFGGYDFLLENNFGENCCAIKDDGGVFYTYGKGDIAKVYDKTKRIVRNNIAINSIGTNEGKPSWFDGTALPYASVEAYYFDDDSNEITFTGNIGIGCRLGTKHHNNQEIISTGNLFVGNKSAQVLFANNNLGTYKNRNITFNNNILYSEADQFIIRFDSIDSNGGMPTDAALLGDLNNNYYMRPSNELSIIRIEKTGTSPNISTFSLASWKSSGYNHDSNSKSTPTNSTVYEIALNDSLENIIYDLDRIRLDINGIQVNEPFGLDAFSAELLLDDLGPIVVPVEEYTINLIQSSGGTIYGGGEFSEGEEVELIASPLPTYTFTKWSDESTDNPYKFNATENLDMSAVFTKKPNSDKGYFTISGLFKVHKKLT